MNIVFTDYCNKSCPYCFAKNKLALGKNSKRGYISLRNLKIVIDFLKRSKINEVKVMGGEPTLHPQFKKALSLLIEHGLHAMIFSNGLIKQDILSFLNSLDANKWSMLLNIHVPRSYRQNEWSMVEGTAELLNKQVSLSFNIYQLDDDMDFITDFIKRHHTYKFLRLGIAMPILGGNNKYVKLKDYPRVSNKIVRFIEKHKEKGISVGFDCGFTLCSFTDTQLGKLARFGTSLRFYCEPGPDVGPDLNLWRCFPTSMIWNKKLTDFKDLNAVYKFYLEKSRALRRVGSNDKCFRCRHLELGRCAGGCLGHTLRLFKLENRLEELV
jgi:sulfatase maturation enzyme AslB (radical SAM superfamily)